MCKGSKAQGLQQDKHFKTRAEQKKRTCAILHWNDNNNKDDTLPYCPTTAIALQWNGTAEQRRNENNEDDRVNLAIARSLAPSLPSCWVQRSEGCWSSPHWGWGAHLMWDVKRGKIRQIFGRHVFHQLFCWICVLNMKQHYATQKWTLRGENRRGVQFVAVQFRIQQISEKPFWWCNVLLFWWHSQL